MPLQVSKGSPSEIAKQLTSNASASQPSFLVVYASLTNGKSWCGDCRQAEPFVNKIFASKPETVTVVYAGQPAEWRTPSNPYRQAPFLIEKLPTLVKVTEDGTWSRLVEGDVYDQKKLNAFVGQ